MARPAKYNRDEALTKAMELFWERGYSASSMSDLGSAMDMRPGSIYATFGSKQELLFEVIDRYSLLARQNLEQRLDQAPDCRSGMEAVFAGMIEEMDCQATVKGCMLINLLLELSNTNEDASQRVQAHLKDLRSVFKEALEKAREQGDLSPKQDPDKLATFLLGSVYSLRVMGKSSATRSDLEGIVEQALLHVFGDDPARTPQAQPA